MCGSLYGDSTCCAGAVAVSIDRVADGPRRNVDTLNISIEELTHELVQELARVLEEDPSTIDVYVCARLHVLCAVCLIVAAFGTAQAHELCPPWHGLHEDAFAVRRASASISASLNPRADVQSRHEHHVDHNKSKAVDRAACER